MTRKQIIIVISGLFLVLILYSLPKVVVDNDPVINSEKEAAHSSEADKDPGFSATLNSLKDSLSTSTDTKKSAIFADSLASSYRRLNFFDSAALVYELVWQQEDQPEMLEKAADAYFEAYTYAVDDEKRRSLADKAEDFYKQIMEKDPGNLDAKTNLGMIYVGTENPMQGIVLLREVLETDPAHYNALYNMGVLSLQSNQVSRAVERFEALVKAYPESTEGRFYLALSYLRSGQKEKAREQFEIVKEKEKDPTVQATVDSYLEEIE